MRSYYDGSQTHIAMTVANTAVLDLRADGLSTFSGDVVIGGGLTINGTTTTINSTTLQVDDKNIELGTVATPSDTTADGGGITLKGASDYYIKWQNSTNSWHFNQGITVGVDDAGHDVKFFGATAGRYLLWDESANALTGAYDVSKIISVGGSSISERKYYKTISGASISSIINEKAIDDNSRIISGNVLTGEQVNLDGFLGFRSSRPDEASVFS